MGKFFARIENGIVAEIIDVNPQGRFHPSLVWVECDEAIQPGWLYDGEKFAPPVPVEPEAYVPQQVTRAQGKAALITSGLWSDVESYVDSITDPTEKALALVALNDTTHWQRSSPFLNSAAAALGLSDEDLDNLFIQASEIEL